MITKSDLLSMISEQDDRTELTVRVGEALVRVHSIDEVVTRGNRRVELSIAPPIAMTVVIDDQEESIWVLWGASKGELEDMWAEFREECRINLDYNIRDFGASLARNIPLAQPQVCEWLHFGMEDDTD